MIKILGIGSCLTLLSLYRSGAERYFEQMGMIRFFRIDCINNYLVNGIDHDELQAFDALELDDKQKEALRQQYLGIGLGASFESTRIINNDLVDIIKESKAIIMDTFFDQRAKLIKKKNSNKTPVFLKLPDSELTDEFDIVDKLSADQIKQEYCKWYSFVNEINPECKVIVLNFTPLDYLENEEKLALLCDIDKHMIEISGGNLYYVCHQDFSIDNFDDLNGKRTLRNHLSIPTYQKYITLINDIINDNVTTNVFNSDTINQYFNMIGDVNVKI